MALEGLGKNLGALDTQTNAVVLDGRNGGLGNAGKTSQLALAQFLEFTKNTHGLADRDADAATRIGDRRDIGAPAVANDSMSLNQCDVFVMLNPIDDWESGMTKEELIEKMSKKLEAEVPGAASFGFNQAETRPSSIKTLIPVFSCPCGSIK